MAGLDKDDLRQMSRNYFQSLDKEKLVEVAGNLHQLAIEQWEKINSDSSNSSQPPSADNPFQKQNNSSNPSNDIPQEGSNSQSLGKNKRPQQQTESKKKTKPGRQKGSKGFGRSKPLLIDLLHK